MLHIHRYAETIEHTAHGMELRQCACGKTKWRLLRHG